jgi:YD repeat-containing protein
VRTYGYDAAGQLLGDGAASFSYDDAGNRTGSGYQTGAANQLTTDGTFTYTYDAEGNLTQKSKGAGQETWYYSYDQRNLLTNVQKTSNGTSITLDVTYVYDALGDLVEQDRWVASTGTVTTFYANDRGQAFADTDTSNNVQVRYLRDEQGGLLARSVASGPNAGLAFYVSDYLGSVRDLINASGQVIDHLDYGPYGNILTESSPTAGDRFKYGQGDRRRHGGHRHGHRADALRRPLLRQRHRPMDQPGPAGLRWRGHQPLPLRRQWPYQLHRPVWFGQGVWR